MTDIVLTYPKQNGGAEAGGNFYEIKLVMLFLLRGIVAFDKGQIDSFRLASNLDSAHPFDDVVFVYTKRGQSELILLQAKHKKESKKNVIAWNTLMNSKDKNFGLKVYMDGSMKMNLDQVLGGPFARRDFVLYTNASFNSNKHENSTRRDNEVNQFYRADDISVTKIVSDGDVYDSLKVPSSVDTSETSKEDIEEFLNNFYFAHSQPGEEGLENIIKREIATFYGISQSDADVIYVEVNSKIQSWWKNHNYYLTETNDWFGMARRNLSEPSLIYAVDLLKTKLGNTRLVYKSNDSFKKSLESSQIINVIANETTCILSLIQTYQALNQYFSSNHHYILLDQKYFKRMFTKVIDAFRSEHGSNLLLISSNETMPEELIQILKENVKKQVVWIGKKIDSAQVNVTHILSEDGFEYLTDESQHDILANSQIRLQGHVVPLAELVKTTHWEETITDDLLADLACDGIAEVGQPMSIQEDSYYIHRTLERDSDEFDSVDIQTYIPGDVKPTFVLISASPGMGKSSLISNMTGGPFNWKYRINLREHSTILKNTKNADALEFMKEAKRMDDQEYRLFKVSYEDKGKIVLFFDGFDEIAPDYKETVLDLLQSLRQSKVDQVWITTRPSFERELENMLGTKAYQLRPFSTEDQKNYLKNVWETSDDSLVEGHLNKFSNVIKDGNFVGVPLHLKMISEMRDEQFSKEMNIFIVYDRFFYNKFYQVAMKDKASMDLDNLQVKHMIDESYKRVWNKHEKLAIFVLFEECDLLQLISTDDIEDIRTMMEDEIERGCEKSGIVCSIVDDKPVFVHRTFAEFFAASWLKKYFCKYQKKKKFQNFNIYKSMYDEENYILRLFFDFALSENCEACKAVLCKDLDKIKAMSIDELKKEDSAGRTAFHLAKMYLYDDISDFFFDKGANNSTDDKIFEFNPFNYRDMIFYNSKRKKVCYNKYKWVRNEMTTVYNNLHWACAVGMIDSVEKCLQSGVDVNLKDDDNLTPLHLAAARGHLEIIARLIDHQASWNSVDDDGLTPIHSAAMFNQIEALKLLLGNEMAIRVNVKDIQGFTPLHWSVTYGLKDIAKTLVDHGADLNSKERIGWAPLHMAVKNKHRDVVEVLLDCGADVNVTNDLLYTPLHYAASNGHVDMVRLLLDRGAEIDMRNELGNTALHNAALYGHGGPAKILMDRGANPKAVNLKGSSVLHMVANSGNGDIARLVLDGGADLDVVDQANNTPLHVAVFNGNTEVAKSFILRGANAKAVIINGWTMLHVAALNGHRDLIQILVDKGVDVNATADGWTALQIAVSNNHGDLVNDLIKLGADPNAGDVNGSNPLHCVARTGRTDIALMLMTNQVNLNVERSFSPLHVAAEHGHSEIAKIFIQHGALVDARDDQDRTPLHLAAQHGRCEVARVLLEHGADLEAKCAQGRSPFDEADQNGHADCARLLTDSECGRK